MEEIKKIALVTGATRGIGRAIALALAKNGSIVIGSATTTAGVDNINECLKPYNGSGILLNIADKDSIEQAIATINQRYGDITILVNNAGITKDGLLMRMKEEQWDEVINTNLKSVFLLAKAVVRGMMKVRFGRIINITSVVAFMGNPGQSNYCSSKAGMVSFTKSLAKEVGSRNITVNCVSPGFIATDMTDKLSLEQKDAYLKTVPLERFGTVEDIAAAVKFLASDEASYITGTTLHVNGGLYM